MTFAGAERAVAETTVTGDELVALARAAEPLVEFDDPSPESVLVGVEAHLGVRLPLELRGFLLRSDGATIAVRLPSGELVRRASPLVWSLSAIVQENEGFPHRPNVPANVLFFANAGFDGILLGHRLDGDALEDQVVVWHPIRSTVSPFTPSFGRYLEGWLSGELSV